MNDKERIDIAVARIGSCSRQHAQLLIRSGCVYISGKKFDGKPGTQVFSDLIEIRGEPLRYVSRGGLKLEKALKTFGISIFGATCADIGASTGGFTDCMLQNGAARVYAIDVGTGQLDEKLISDTRVVNLEKTNFRYVTERDVPDKLEFASVDVSFISLKLILPVLCNLLNNNATAVCLIKPQFEAGRGHVGKNGVVRDPEIHLQVILSIIDFAIQNGFSPLNLDYSPIKGPMGNIEYLIEIQRSDKPENLIGIAVTDIVAASHKTLDESEDDAR